MTVTWKNLVPILHGTWTDKASAFECINAHKDLLKRGIECALYARGKGNEQSFQAFQTLEVDCVQLLRVHDSILQERPG